jgi:hypothetical protein
MTDMAQNINIPHGHPHVIAYTTCVYSVRVGTVMHIAIHTARFSLGICRLTRSLFPHQGYCGGSREQTDDRLTLPSHVIGA